MKVKTHDLNHDLTFYAHTINCVCNSIRSMFRVLGIYNFGSWQKVQEMIVKQTFTPVANFGHQALHLLALEL